MDDKIIKALTQVIKEQFEENFIRLFNEGFEAVVMPNIERLGNKIDKLDQRVDRLGNRVDQMDRKLDKFSADVINHETRVKKLESAKIAA